MLRAASFLILAAGISVLCGCLSTETVRGARYLFEIRFRDVEGLPQEQTQYAVFEEIRIIKGDMEFPRSSRLAQAELCLGDSHNFEYRVPQTTRTVWTVPFLWAATTWSLPEHRFTIFSPDYVAATVYPLGIHGTPPSESESMNRWDSPGLLGAYFHTMHATCDSVKTPLGCVREANGVFRSVISLGQLPSIVDARAVQLFSYQMWVVDQSIKTDVLDSVDVGTRKLVCDAVRLQHDAFSRGIVEVQGRFDRYGSHAPTFGECITRKESPCRRIHTWANQSSPVR